MIYRAFRKGIGEEAQVGMDWKDRSNELKSKGQGHKACEA
jgi:hypothetical protein